MRYFQAFVLASSTLIAMGLVGCQEGGRVDALADNRSDQLPSGSVVRFIAVGDTGSGSDGQYAVGEAMAQVCAERGCDFALGLGDNIYESGTGSALDPQFEEKFEVPFAPVNIPFYMVLGNHDNSEFFGGDGAGNARGDTQVDYHYRDIDHPDQPRLTQRWKMPARYYNFQAGMENGQPLVEFFGIDSSQPAGGFPDSDQNFSYNNYGLAQLDWLKQGLEQSTAQWKLVFAHHPYVSNGSHGNAGNYDGIPGPLLPVLAGQRYKDFLEEAMCDRADYFLNGHDHDLQWLKPQPSCGRTGFITSGAGSKVRSLVNRNSNPAHYQAGDVYGFFWLEIDGDSLRGEVYEVDPALQSLGIRDPQGALKPSFSLREGQREPVGLAHSQRFSAVPFLGIPSQPGPDAGRDYSLQAGPLDAVQSTFADSLQTLASALPGDGSAQALLHLSRATELLLDAPDALIHGLQRVVTTANPDTGRAGAALATQAMLAAIAELEAAAPLLAAVSPRYADLPQLFSRYRQGLLATTSSQTGGLARAIAPVIQLVRNIENIVDAIEEETDPIPVLDPALAMVSQLLLDVTDVLAATAATNTSALSQELAATVDNLLRHLLLRVIPVEQAAPAEVTQALGLVPSFLGSVLLLVLQEPSYLLDPLLLPILEPVNGLLDAVLGVILPPA
jgi:hypothetical protein